MRSGNDGRVPTLAIMVAALGAVAVLVSPLRPWTVAVAICGLVLFVPAAAVMIVRLLR